ncbi:adenylosuccinate lyase [Sedimentibacter hydroxybenzoicus DSM 7310]|uniref:Adenylosuccinate lyase n=1 Tax=Sedimentibacter hydroxybenzoicus DSM 7310 TaxID=1123245 RepID=A0A974BI89_SEDHY|nr:adenylosuccinate lyase [Sedimentibacter hydroxybenzoicus]NYB73602.1 adenylosuccinate lyase [Sedimentibacter hydroxybenzoicus DSM 7310]
MSRDTYENPLITRYSSKEMLYIFSDEKKFSTWRKLWVALAEAEKELGLSITGEQIEEMKANIYNIDYDLAAQKEKEFRHDVMAHVHTFGTCCPSAMPIIHLGATSMYVVDNTDAILMKEALLLLKKKLINLIKVLSDFCLKYKDLPALGYTHYQPAQLTTVGKRASLWLQDLYLDYEEVNHVLSLVKLRGVKGTTGTQASFMNLFDNDGDKVKELEKKVVEKMGFKDAFKLTGQTYTRKVDFYVLSTLSGIAQSLHKMTNDIRILQSQKEIEEPFEKNQIGSSAMAYKRNPMRSERIASLARFIISNEANMANTVTTQWLERTLDDSAIKRLAIPQGFLAADAILGIAINIFGGMVVNEKVIEKHINEELPFMATENIIMEAVKRGGNRQDLHEEIRVLSMQAAEQVKKFGMPNDLIERMSKSNVINMSREEIEITINPANYTGRAPQQVEEFFNETIEPLLEENRDLLGVDIELKV